MRGGKFFGFFYFKNRENLVLKFTLHHCRRILTELTKEKAFSFSKAVLLCFSVLLLLFLCVCVCDLTAASKALLYLPQSMSSICFDMSFST